MARTRRNSKRSGRSKRTFLTARPNGIIHPRVKAVGPEHFGVVAVDCAKARSKWMLCDFYGNVLVPPAEVEHARGHLRGAVLRLRHAIDQHGLRDQIVAVERTGSYHLPVKRAFADAGFETRIVHPFATKQYRQPADPGNKTDETDLAAIFRAAVGGFGLIEQPLDELFANLRLLVRHRRDLVEKRTAVYCQIREHLEAVLPGYAACFQDLWESPVALFLARRCPSPDAFRALGVDGLDRMLRDGRRLFQRRTLERIVAWAGMAVPPDPAAETHRRIWLALDEDRHAKTLQIRALERDIAALLVQTPYVLLLSIAGVNVVSAGELAGEMGPIAHYANAKAITGRAGLFPARFQSDRIDHADGPLVRCANRSLRAALMMIADNLVTCNPWFRGLAALWEAQGKDPRHTRVKVASRFSRIAFQLVSGGRVFRHPSCRRRDYVLDKLLAFHREHDTPVAQIMQDLDAAIGQLPRTEYRNEAAPLAEELRKTQAARSRRPQPIGSLLPLVLARLGVGQVQSRPSEDRNPD